MNRIERKAKAIAELKVGDSVTLHRRRGRAMEVLEINENRTVFLVKVDDHGTNFYVQDYEIDGIFPKVNGNARPHNF